MISAPFQTPIQFQGSVVGCSANIDQIRVRDSKSVSTSHQFLPRVNHWDAICRTFVLSGTKAERTSTVLLFWVGGPRLNGRKNVPSDMMKEEGDTISNTYPFSTIHRDPHGMELTPVNCLNLACPSIMTCILPPGLYRPPRP